MKNNIRLINSILIMLILIGGIFALQISLSKQRVVATQTTDNVSIKTVASQITASGLITAQNQADLHFQTGGKLVTLPFKEGDTVTIGQTIAQLDTYQL